MTGLVLALIVVGVVLSLLGLWIVSIPVVALGLFVLFIVGRGRRTAARTPR